MIVGGIFWSVSTELLHKQLEMHGYLFSAVATDTLVIKLQAIIASVSTVLSKY